jgi:hypothetical protein
MVINFKLITEVGEFISDEMRVTNEQYQNLLEMSKKFYDGGFDMWLPSGFLVASPEIIKKSILIIQIVNQDG